MFGRCEGDGIHWEGVLSFSFLLPIFFWFFFIKRCFLESFSVFGVVL
jgi:hypothetical protein